MDRWKIKTLRFNHKRQDDTIENKVITTTENNSLNIIKTRQNVFSGPSSILTHS